MKKAIKLTFVALLFSVVAIIRVGPALADEAADRVRELERIIAAQQAQLSAQADLLNRLQAEVQNLARSTANAQTAAVAAGNKAAENQKKIQQVAAPAGVVASGNDKVSLKLYGQVNRALLYIDDGATQEIFHVDNDHSSTRIGLSGNVKANDDLDIGANIEVQMESNSTANVNQANNSSVIASNSFTERHLDLFFDSKSLGKLSMGQGSTASDGTSQSDLSGTTLVGYSSTSDLAGGISLATSSTGAITGNPTLGTVISDMDGLSRDDRLRYDTPSLAGYSVATSWVDGGNVDLALRYAGKGENSQIAASLGYANPSGTSSTISRQLNGSVSVLLGDRFNLTMAAGRQSMKVAARNNPDFYYGKLGYIARLTDLGPTSFAFDYGRYDEVAQNDDELTTFAAMFVQSYSDWGTDIYAVWRNYDLARPGSSFDDVNAAMIGARVKF